MNKCIYRQEQPKAVVFIYSDGESKVQIFSNQIRKRVEDGPYLEFDVTIPEALKAEIKSIKSWKVGQSDALKAFCRDCLQQAARKNSFFNCFINV